jgi:hypothetical protein
MKYDKKNALKLQIATYIEESLSMVGKMMLEEIFDKIENLSEDEGESLVDSYYNNNVFELIKPYLDLAHAEYEKFRKTPEGIAAMQELKDVMEQTKQLAIEYKPIKIPNGNEGGGNVH